MTESGIRYASAHVPPEAIAAYARSKGWSKTERYGDYSHVYGGQDLPEIVIPDTDEIVDYQHVLYRLVQVFAQVLNASTDRIWTDVKFANRDVFRLSVPSEDEPGISAEAFQGLAKSLKGLFRASARMEQGQGSKNLMDGVRFGHTEPGSYSIVMMTPTIEYKDRQIWDDPTQYPIERRVTNRLSDCLSATVRIIKSDIEEAVRAELMPSLNSQWLAAFRDISRPVQSAKLDITRAKTLLSSDRKPIERFEIARENVEVLDKALSELGKTVEHGPIVGIVKSVTRELADESGTISMEAEVDGKHRVVKAVLRDSDYRKAVMAHLERAQIAVSGSLINVKNRWKILEAQLENRQ